MQFRFLRAFLFIIYFIPQCYGMESQSEKDLYLIVGSLRREGLVNPWWGRIMNGETDFTHRSTFDGKATSLDIKPCEFSNLPHIQADARTYDPENRKIQKIFIELLPSIDIHEIGAKIEEGKDGNEKFKQLMLMSDAITNLARFMPTGATLDIEHLPHFTLLDSNFYANYVSYLKKENPFHCFISPLFMESLKARDIKSEQRINYWSSIRDKKILEGWNIEDTNVIIDELERSQEILLNALENIKSLLGVADKPFNNRLDAEISMHDKDHHKFVAGFHASLSSVIIQEFHMLKHKNLITTFLQERSFENIQIRHQDCAYNGRKNVWMISSVKK